MRTEQDRRISDAFKRDSARLRNFIRKRVADEAEAEDILQDVFYDFVAAFRLMKQVEQVTAWLFRVARNRIIDRFRRKGREAARATAAATDEDEAIWWEDLLPSPDAGPEAAFVRSVLMEELDEALEELPPEQREVFVAHEIEGSSFKEIAERTGVSVNTLLSRKHYAVLHLRRRLQAIYNDFRKR